jgi:hypothetical protein
MVPIYEIFVRDFKSGLDFSEDMLYEQYLNESVGGECSRNNGYHYGKKYMDVTIKMWREDISLGNLFLFELYDDPTFPDWWLDRVFNKRYNNTLT